MRYVDRAISRRRLVLGALVDGRDRLQPLRGRAQPAAADHHGSAQARQAMTDWTPVPYGPAHRVIYDRPLLERSRSTAGRSARPAMDHADAHRAVAHHCDPSRARDGLQSFGTIDVTADALTIGLRGIDGRERYRVELPHVS